jgi:hypothetical protein
MPAKQAFSRVPPRSADCPAGARRTEPPIDVRLRGGDVHRVDGSARSGSPRQSKFLRGLDAHTLDLSVLPAERRRFLATVGRRLTAQALQRREAERRYPILLTLLSQSATEALDEVVQLFDQARLGAGEQGRAQDARRAGRARQGR